MNFWRTIAKPIIGLSPMDGVTDASFRLIVAKHGRPDVVFTEFVNVESAFFAPQTLLKDLTYSEIERPVVAQIYGHTPEMFYKLAQIMCELGFDGIDINMGCPARKVAAKGSGAALILNPELACSIIRAARQGINDWFSGKTLLELGIDSELIQRIALANRSRTGDSSPPLRRLIPLSVKTRIGYDRIVVDDWIRTLLDQQPAVISLHGRTLQQKYTGVADWEAIARAVEIAAGSETLILGNGDLRDMGDVCRRMSKTKVDGALLGRATQGNPWIFRTKGRVKNVPSWSRALDLPEYSPGLQERFSVMLEHSTHFEQHWGRQSFVGMRKHLAWYCSGLRRAAELRAQLVRVNNTLEVIDCLTNYGRSLQERTVVQGHSGHAL